MTNEINQKHFEDCRQPQKNSSSLNLTLQNDQIATVLKRKSFDPNDKNEPQNISAFENNDGTPKAVKKTKKNKKSKDKSDSNNENNNNGPKLQCEFFLKKKNRRCRMMRKASQKYCAEHLVVEQQPETTDEKNNNNDGQKAIKSDSNLAVKRVPCPVDPSHSVWEKNLKEHINRCNRAKSQRIPESQPWFIRNLNDCSKQEKVTKNTLDDNVNSEQQHQQQSKAEIDYAYWVPIIEKAYQNLISTHLPQSSSPTSSIELKLDQKTFKDNDSISDRLSQLTNQKHIIQQSSLIAHLDSQGLYGPQFNYIEFGCGRAELSRYLSKAIVYETLNKNAQIAHDNTVNSGANVEMPGFLLIDRSPVRMKMDTKIGKDYADIKQFFEKKSNNNDENEQATDDSNSGINGNKKITNADNGEPPFAHRVKIDIKDLNLDYCLQLPGFNKPRPQNLPKKFVGISKHLCGCATDLTLQCIFNSEVLTTGLQASQNEAVSKGKNTPTFDRFGGLIVAMCCRHVCNYPQFLPAAKQFLASVFEIVTPSENSTQDKEHNRNYDEEKLKAIFNVITKMVSWATCGRREGMQDNDINNHGSGLTVLQREQLGLKARRLIDESRLAAIRAAGLNAEICHYVEKEISLENVCLIVTPKRKP